MDIEVVEAVLSGTEDTSNHWTFILEVTHDDGRTERKAHVMPEETFEWRAAEYGIDPADVDTLLEVALLEPYLDDDTEHPDSLFRAASPAAARRHHLARIAARKGRGRIRDRNRRSGEARSINPARMRGVVLLDSDLDDDTPLAMLRREARIDPDRVAVMHEVVAHQRAQVRRERDQPAADRERIRAALPAAELRRQLLGDNTRTHP